MPLGDGRTKGVRSSRWASGVPPAMNLASTAQAPCSVEDQGVDIELLYILPHKAWGAAAGPHKGLLSKAMRPAD